MDLHFTTPASGTVKAFYERIAEAENSGHRFEVSIQSGPGIAVLTVKAVPKDGPTDIMRD